MLGPAINSLEKLGSSVGQRQSSRSNAVIANRSPVSAPRAATWLQHLSPYVLGRRAQARDDALQLCHPSSFAVAGILWSTTFPLRSAFYLLPLVVLANGLRAPCTSASWCGSRRRPRICWSRTRPNVRVRSRSSASIRRGRIRIPVALTNLRRRGVCATREGRGSVPPRDLCASSEGGSCRTSEQPAPTADEVDGRMLGDGCLATDELVH